MFSATVWDGPPLPGGVVAAGGPLVDPDPGGLACPLTVVGGAGVPSGAPLPALYAPPLP